MQVEAYKIVQSLLVETDEAAFDIMLKEALKIKNLNKINSTILKERPSLDSHVTDEEMIICEDRKVLEKEAHADNLRATSTRAEIFKEEFLKRGIQLLNKVSPEQYYNILTLLKNNVDSSHLFPEANQEIVSRSLNMEPPNKKIKTQICFNKKEDFSENFNNIEKTYPRRMSKCINESGFDSKICIKINFWF
ncbi:hypothetical protein TNCV_810621 [Trichonephila clavipes]|uniref:Uncharacterized protein n=1 Tax=Trichonephila clavipes TaxID=2585209 RepID=A0A8X6VDI5_TRICX|nr:hypothetical protein TNCV_810621 [Trichonephila clavipes]